MSEYGFCEECGERLASNTIRSYWKKKLCKSVRCGVKAGIVKEGDVKRYKPRGENKREHSPRLFVYRGTV